MTDLKNVCPFFNRRAILTPDWKTGGVLEPSTREECALLTETRARCRMLEAGKEPQLNYCELGVSDRARAALTFPLPHEIIQDRPAPAAGHYWVYHHDRWQHGRYDGEDWELEDGTSNARVRIIGPRWEVPPQPTEPPADASTAAATRAATPSTGYGYRAAAILRRMAPSGERLKLLLQMNSPAKP